VVSYACIIMSFFAKHYYDDNTTWMTWMRHSVLMGEEGDACNITVWKSDGNIILEKKTGFKPTSCCSFMGIFFDLENKICSSETSAIVLTTLYHILSRSKLLPPTSIQLSIHNYRSFSFRLL
jgi:hypothetical protein